MDRKPSRLPYYGTLEEIVDYEAYFDYIIYSSGGFYKAYNGATGALAKSSTAFHTTCNYCLANSYRTLIKCSPSLTGTITPYDNTYLELAHRHTITLAASSDISIVGNVCVSNGDTSPAGANFYIAGQDHNVSGNTSQDSSDNGIAIFADNCMIIGNHSIDDAEDGIYVYAQNPTIDGNSIQGAGDDGIYVNDATKNATKGVIISNNTITDVGDRGIRNYLFHAVIIGNNIYTAVAEGIALDSADEFQVVVFFVQGCTDGIAIINADNTVVNGCRCTGNSANGVSEEGTSDYTLLDGCVLIGNTGSSHTVDVANSVVGDVIA